MSDLPVSVVVMTPNPLLFRRPTVSVAAVRIPPAGRGSGRPAVGAEVPTTKTCKAVVVAPTLRFTAAGAAGREEAAGVSDAHAPNVREREGSNTAS